VNQLNEPTNDTGIERIFHTENRPSERIKLASYDGPAGPIYSVFDGTHRIAGIKASGLGKFPAEIYRIKYPYKKTSTEPEEIADWQSKIDRGFIKGKIERGSNEKGEYTEVTILSEIVPWIRTTDANRIFKINREYERQYPGALTKIGFPPETLTDISALWAYLDGNFDQWKKFQEL
jgi:hypothetical protein